MDLVAIAGILLTFGSVGAAYYVRANPAAHFATWMRSPFVAFLANGGGLISGFLAIYLLVSSLGWPTGIGVWVAVGLCSAFVVGLTMDAIYPLILLLSFVAMLFGVLLWSIGSTHQTESKRSQIELGDFIRYVMLKPDEKPRWDMRADEDSPINWKTKGVEEETRLSMPNRLPEGVAWDSDTAIESVGSFRSGIAKINVMGERPTVLKKRRIPIPWQIKLTSSMPKKFPPQSLIASPKDCFGSGNTGCYFELIKSLEGANISSASICTTPKYRFSNGTLLMKISAKGRQDAFLAYTKSAGSGGKSSSVQIYWSLDLEDKNNICERMY